MAARHWRILATCIGLIPVVLVLAGGPAAADAPGNEHFLRTWARTDKPIYTQGVERSWIWGPAAISGLMPESYEQSEPDGVRWVQYFDKSRMEITHPDGDPASPWYVTNGLLARELITGMRQEGDDTFEELPPADVPVAGDPDDAGGPTYATFRELLDDRLEVLQEIVTRVVQRDGSTSFDERYAAYNVSALTWSEPTQHWIAAPFWEFMNSSGMIYVDGQFVAGRLFQDPYYATGLPITEPYWADVKVAGEQRDVLLQCFERRCLTYTPDNPADWQVEMGNVGRHYYTWRYGPPPEQPSGAIAWVRPTTDALATMRADGSLQRDVSDSDTGANDPDISPDGTRVLFVSWTGSGAAYNQDLFVANIDGSDRRNLTNAPGDDWAARWSPDGSRVAYVSGSQAQRRIWVMNADGSGARVVSNGPGDGYPVWSPDGTLIAFTSGRVDEIGRFVALYVTSPEGPGDERQLAACGHTPVWVPGSHRLIYNERSYCGDEMFEIDADTLERTRFEPEITEGLVFERDIVFSPDGRMAAFTIGIADNQEVYIANADFSDIQRITNDPGADYHPVWSPDSRWLAFIGSRDGWRGIIAVNLENRWPEHRITPPDEVGSSEFDWGP